METFYTCTRSEWRDYLSRNCRTAPEVWFVFPMKASGEKTRAGKKIIGYGGIDKYYK